MKRRYVIPFHVGYWLLYLMLLSLVLSLAARPVAHHPLPSEVLLFSPPVISLTVPGRDRVLHGVPGPLPESRSTKVRRARRHHRGDRAGSAALGLAVLYLVAGT